MCRDSLILDRPMGRRRTQGFHPNRPAAGDEGGSLVGVNRRGVYGSLETAVDEST